MRKRRGQVGFFLCIVLTSFLLVNGAYALETIEMWSYVPEGNYLYTLIDQFNQSQDEIKVIAKFIPFGELKRQVAIAIAAGEPPDFMLVDNPDHASFTAIGAFADLTDKWATWEYSFEDFYPGPVRSTQWEGRTYGVPIETNTLALFYNVDMFEEAGLDPNRPPTTWEELTVYAAKLTKPGVYGLSVSAIGTEEGTFQWLPFLWQNGVDIDELDTPQAVEALELWVDWIEKGYVSKEIVNMDQWSGVRVQFVEEGAAMMINGPWCLPAMGEVNFKVALLPGRVERASAMGGVNFALFKDKNVDAAWEFIKWVYEPGTGRAEELWYKWGCMPLLKEVAEISPYWKDPIGQVFIEQMKYARPRGPHPKWPQISEAIYTALQEALLGVKTSKQALEDAARKIEKIL
jgi:multiple sugar transport system substrate-binding protein